MKKLFNVLAILAAVLVVSGIISGGAHAAASPTIPQGVEVEGIDLSNMTPEEAKAALNDFIDQVKGRTLHLTDGQDVVMDIPFSQFGVDIADPGVVDTLSRIGSGGNILKRYKALRDVQNGHGDYQIRFTCDTAALENILNERAGEVNREPEDAILVRHGGQLLITDEVIGRTLKAAETAQLVSDTITRGWDRQDLSIEAAFDQAAPAHTAQELSVVQDVLGTYTTSFAGSSYNRIENIKNGAAKIDETVLYPGDEFSFTQAVAPFTSDNGYYLAGGYASGKTVDTMGGGICQVSSTLYNTVLRSELTVLERTNHMMTVGYVPLGADATIAEPTIDFKFRNDYEYPVYIEAYTYGSSVTVTFYGKETRPQNRTLEFESVTEQTINPGPDVVTEDPTLPEGYEKVTQSAHTGYVASFYKLVYVDGNLESRELINRSTYNAYPRYVTRGTKPPETQPPETQAPETQAPQTTVPEAAPDGAGSGA
ncbi:MAG TPA: VanW family protein [Candidatus Scybalocola faecavium]|nr:VanW family protein [Candidatus Scybalocola faecavium]